MDSTVEQSTTYHVDAEHGRLRLVVLLLFIGTWAISYFILSALLQANGLNLIAVLFSFAVAYVITNLIEKQLKLRWPSGRAVVVDSEGVKLVRNGQQEQEMRADQAVSPIYWRFTVRKRARVPKGWLMYACALEHEEKHLTVYTFLPPSSVDDYDRASQFKALTGKKEAKGRTDLRLAGEQRRLHEAENYRWLNGAEMNADDFKRYIAQLETQFPEWSPIQ
jgi:hypothetical protein